MFTAIAGVYDLNNTLLSFGLHYRWKKLTASFVPLTRNGTALDVGAARPDKSVIAKARPDFLMIQETNKAGESLTFATEFGLQSQT